MSAFDDLSCTVEERIKSHYVGRVRALTAPPLEYRVHACDFDGMTRRLRAKVELGERRPDFTRSESIVLHFEHGAVSVFMHPGAGAEGRIEAVEFDGRTDGPR